MQDFQQLRNNEERVSQGWGRWFAAGLWVLGGFAVIGLAVGLPYAARLTSGAHISRIGGRFIAAFGSMLGAAIMAVGIGPTLAAAAAPSDPNLIDPAIAEEANQRTNAERAALEVKNEALERQLAEANARNERVERRGDEAERQRTVDYAFLMKAVDSIGEDTRAVRYGLTSAGILSHHERGPRRGGGREDASASDRPSTHPSASGSG
jgi:hypothetical protein